MAIPKAYQAQSQIKKKNEVNSTKTDALGTPSFTSLQKKAFGREIRSINLQKKTKFLWLGLIYTIIFCFIKCLLIVTKWESGEYKFSFFGVSLSIGKKATATTPNQQPIKSPEKSTENSPEKKAESGNTVSPINDPNLPKTTTLQTDTTDFDALSTSSPKEVAILLKLAERRQEVEKRETQIKERELALDIAMKQQKDKVEELTKLKESIESLLKKTDKLSHEQSVNLVKIYEGMKPKNAAQIFDKIDPIVLKELVPMMSQKKVSNILDQMNPAKAKELSLLLLSDKNPFATPPKK